MKSNLKKSIFYLLIILLITSVIYSTIKQINDYQSSNLLIQSLIAIGTISVSIIAIFPISEKIVSSYHEVNSTCMFHSRGIRRFSCFCVSNTTNKPIFINEVNIINKNIFTSIFKKNIIYIIRPTDNVFQVTHYVDDKEYFTKPVIRTGETYECRFEQNFLERKLEDFNLDYSRQKCYIRIITSESNIDIRITKEMFRPLG